MGSTKKVGSTGRFKGRYGVGVKKRVLAVENKMKAKVPCPFCGFERIEREAAGLFFCTKCGNRFTGGAYETQTLVGKAINKMVSQKSFVEDSKELVQAIEEKSSYSDIEREVESSLNEKKVSEEPKRKQRKKKEEVVDVVEESVLEDDSEDASESAEDKE